MSAGQGSDRRIIRVAMMLAMAGVVGLVAGQSAKTFVVRRELLRSCARIFGRRMRGPDPVCLR